MLFERDEASCPTGNHTIFTTINSQHYELFCRADFPGFDLPAINATTYTACIEACDDYKLDQLVASGANCVGVTFGATNVNGDKCYLKYQIDEAKPDSLGKVSARRVQYKIGDQPIYDLFPTPSGSATTKVAQPTASTSGTAAPTNSAAPSNSSPSSSTGLSTGAAAGIGVAVGVIVLALIIVAFFILRKRRRRRRDNSIGNNASGGAVHEVGEDNKAYVLHEKDNDPRSGPKHGHVGSIPATGRPVTPTAEKGTSLDVARANNGSRQELAGDEPVRELDGRRI